MKNINLNENSYNISLSKKDAPTRFYEIVDEIKEKFGFEIKKGLKYFFHQLNQEYQLDAMGIISINKKFSTPNHISYFIHKKDTFSDKCINKIMNVNFYLKTLKKDIQNNLNPIYIKNTENHIPQSNLEENLCKIENLASLLIIPVKNFLKGIHLVCLLTYKNPIHLEKIDIQKIKSHIHYMLLSIDSVLLVDQLKEKLNFIDFQGMKLSKELTLAREIQQNIIPNDIPNFKEKDYYFIYKPLDAVGGDFFDFIPIDDKHIGIFISDISGHGVPAAMITTMVKTLLETSKNLISYPSLLMNFLNKKLVNLSGDMFLSAFYGIYNKENKEFQYCYCGHPSPFLIRNNKITELPGERNLILGMFSNISFKEETMLLKTNDKLFFYTDGLTEAMNKDFLLFESVLKSTLLKYNNNSIRNLIEFIYKELVYFCGGEQFIDDICLIGLNIRD